MEISDRVEPLVRETLTAVIKRDPERFARAVAAFSDDEVTTDGIRLAAAVTMFVLHDLHEGHKPTDEELRDIAGDIAKSESWTDIDAGEVFRYLSAIYDTVRIDQVLPVERVIILTYVTTANLVASYHEDGEEWWDFLDRAEAAIEAAPER